RTAFSEVSAAAFVAFACGSRAGCVKREAMKTLVPPVPGGTAAKRLTRLLFVRAAAALLAFWVAGSCLAGDAVFSNDGQRVYTIGNADNKQVLREINLTEQTSRTISLSQLPSQQPLLGITRSDGDKLFCVTEKNIWTFAPGSNRLTKVCGSPKGGP